MTLREYYRELVVFARRTKKEWERAVTLVYTGAWLQRAERMPSLQLVLHGHDGQSKEQQGAMWQYIADSLGITPKVHDKRSRKFRIIRPIRHGE